MIERVKLMAGIIRKKTTTKISMPSDTREDGRLQQICYNMVTI